MGTLSGEATLLFSCLPPLSTGVNSKRKEFAAIYKLIKYFKGPCHLG